MFEPAPWSALLDILPSLAKANVMDDASRDALEHQARLGLMDKAMADGGSDSLKTWWHNQPRKVRQRPALQAAVAEHFIAADDHQTAQQIIYDGLKRQYNEQLILLMPRLKTDDLQAAEARLHSLIKTHGDQPLLWSTLGQMLIKHAEWQEASLAFRTACSSARRL